jgi:serine/threonine protein kinase
VPEDLSSVNSFGAGAPVRWVVGRDSELSALNQALECGKPGVVIRGPRGIGKTALVDRFRSDRCDGGPTVYLDARDYVSGSEVRNEAAARHNLARGIVEELAFSGFLPAHVRPDDVSGGAFFREVLPLICQAGARRLVVAIDELDHLDASVIRTVWRGFFRVRNLPVPPLFVGILGETWSGAGSDVLSETDERFTSIRLGPLRQEDVRALLDRHAAEASFAFARDACDAMWTESGGFPLFLLYLIDAVHQGRAASARSGAATNEEVYRAAQSCGGRIPDRVRHALSQAGPASQRTLLSLAEHQALTTQELLDVVRSDWKVSAEEVTGSVRGLMAAGLVKPESGVLQIAIPLLASWVKKLTAEEVESAEEPPKADAFAAFRDAEALDFQGRRDEAIDRLRTAVHLDGRFWRPRWMLARLLMERAGMSESSHADADEAESYLRNLRNEVPWRGGVLAQVERHICGLLVKRAEVLAPGVEQHRIFCEEILKLDPGLFTPGAREQVAADEVERWARQLQQLPEERWIEATRRLLRHDRCWQDAADRLTAWLDEVVQQGASAQRGRSLVRGVLPPLLEIDPPPGAEAHFWRPLTKWLAMLSHAAPSADGLLSASLWETLLASGEKRRAAVIEAAVGLLERDAVSALRRGSGDESGRLVRILAENRATVQLRACLQQAGDLVVEAADDDVLRAPLNESLASFLTPCLALAASLPTDLVKEARDIVAFFFSTAKGTGELVATPSAINAWKAIQHYAPALESAPAFLTRLRSLAASTGPALRISPADKDAIERLLDHEYSIEERLPLRIASLWTPLAEDSVKTYRASKVGDPRRQFQVRVFDLRGSNPDMFGILRAMWEQERRALAALSVTPSGRALTRFVESRYDKETDRAVLVVDWPGNVTLAEQVEHERTRLRRPGFRAELWGHLAALLESIQALHDANFIHRAISPDVVYVRDGDEMLDARIAPLLKLGHFEWSVYLRGLGLSASPAARALNRYMAPEALRSAFRIERGTAGESFGSDLYSTGLLIFEILVRRFTDEERSSITGYDEAQEESHRQWIEDLQRDVRQGAEKTNGKPAGLDCREAELLLSLLKFNLVDRPLDLRDAISKARSFSMAEFEIELPAYAVTTLTSSESKDPREDARCIAYWLRKELPEVTGPKTQEEAAAELQRKNLERIIEAELGSPTVHLNRKSGEHPLILKSRSGVLFRLQQLEWGEDAQHQVKHSGIAYLEVAREDDRPMEIPIGRLLGGVKLADVDPYEIDRLRREFRESTHGSFARLFEEAEKSRHALESLAAADRKRRVLSEVLGLSVRLEREALTLEISYHREGLEMGRTILRSTDVTENLPALLAHASTEDPHFEVARHRTPLGQGTQVVIAEDGLDFESRTVAVVLADAGEIPEDGVIRPAYVMGAEVQYGRRRRILAQVKEDDYLLNQLADPASDSHRVGTPSPVHPRDVIIRDLDEDKRSIVGQYFSIEPLLAVQGPPATGKTTLAAEIVLRVLQRNPQGRILVTTQGHEPLDNLLERILDEKRANTHAAKVLDEVEMIRIPSGWRARPGEASKFYPHIRAEELYVRLKTWCTRELNSLGLKGIVAAKVHKQLGGYLSVPDSLRRRIQQGANLVFATVNSGHIERELPASYDLVVVEEAARCFPIEVAGAMRLARHWLLIGDHQQLAPFSFEEIGRLFDEYVSGQNARIEREPDAKQRKQQNEWLDDIRKNFHPYLHLLRHLHEAKGDHTATLRTQWRMHPALGDMVSEVFYEGHAVCNPENAEKCAALAARRTHRFTAPDWIKGKQLVWIDMDHATISAECEEQRGQGGLIANRLERRTIVSALGAFRNPRVSKDIAILTPYRHQAEELSGFLRDGYVDNFWAFGAIEDRIFTVDSFQGRQAACVLVSMVRNNRLKSPREAMGFLAERERATVMFSRAEQLLVVIGCAAQFQRFATNGAKWITDIIDRANVIPYREVLASKALEKYGI